jgi:imidazoleglycerol phosphate synthase glutamine amidotransferase subunit HisH
MIAISDYGIGNLGSIRNIIKHLGGTAEITATRESSARRAVSSSRASAHSIRA